MSEMLLMKPDVHRVALLVLPDCSHLGVAAVIEPLFLANWLAQRPLFAWRIVSADGQPVRASNGMTIPVEGELATAAGAATIFVLASFDAQQVVRAASVAGWLRRMARSGAEIAGIENGTLVLAEAGLLDGLEAAVHWDNLIGFRERYPAVRAVDRLYARSGRRLTCAGAAAILDMMAAWIAWQGDPALATEVAAHLLQGPVRAAGTAQRPETAEPAARPDAVVAAAQAIMRDNLEERLSCEAIAARVGLSLRQVERRFLRQTGHSMVQDYLSLRLARAHQLLQQTELGVTDIACACGFTSPAYFSRLYRRTFGCPPSADRRQTVTAPVFRTVRPI